MTLPLMQHVQREICRVVTIQGTSKSSEVPVKPEESLRLVHRQKAQVKRTE